MTTKVTHENRKIHYFLGFIPIPNFSQDHLLSVTNLTKLLTSSPHPEVYTSARACNCYPVGMHLQCKTSAFSF